MENQAYTIIAGLKFYPRTRNELAHEIAEAIMRADVGKHIVTVNSDIFLLAQRNRGYRDVLMHAWALTADGMPLVWLSKLRRCPLPERITGVDLVPEICRAAGGTVARPFFLGAGEGIALQAAKNLESQIAGFKVAGTYSPSSKELDDEESSLRIVEMVNKSRANLLFVALGAPKQENWIYRYKDLLNVSVSIGVGATFDFLAGVVPRAPLWMQRVGVEWLYRLSREPRRLLLRYIRDLAIVLFIVREIFGLSSCNSIRHIDEGDSVDRHITSGRP